MNSGKLFSPPNRAEKTMEEGGISVSNLAPVPLSQIEREREREKESLETGGDEGGGHKVGNTI